MNKLWLLHYVTDTSLRRNQVQNPSQQQRVWFDDIVLATRYTARRSVLGIYLPENADQRRRTQTNADSEP